MAENIQATDSGSVRLNADGRAVAIGSGTLPPWIDARNVATSGNTATFNIAVPAGVAAVRFFGPVLSFDRAVESGAQSIVVDRSELTGDDTDAPSNFIAAACFVTAAGAQGPVQGVPLFFTDGSVAFIGATTITFDPSAIPGAQISVTWAEWTGGSVDDDNPVETFLRTRPEGGGSVTDWPLTETVPSEWDGLEVAAVIRVLDAGDWVESQSAWSLVAAIGGGEDVPPAAIAAADMEITSYYPDFPGQTDPATLQKSRFVFVSGPVATAIADGMVEYIRGTINSGPPYGYELMVPWTAADEVAGPGDAIAYWTWEMDDPDRKWRLVNPNRDWSVIRPDEEALRTARFRLQWKRTDNTEPSLVSEPIYLPTPAETPGAPVLSQIPDVTIPKGGSFEYHLPDFAAGTGALGFSIETSPPDHPAFTLVGDNLQIDDPDGLTYPASASCTVTVTGSVEPPDSETFSLTILATATPPASVQAPWRQIPILGEWFLTQPVNFPDHFPDARLGLDPGKGKWVSEGKQWANSGDMVGERFLVLGDSNGPRGSLDGGRAICHPRGRGFFGNVSHCVKMDPADETRVLAGIWQGSHAPLAYGGRNGIYLSTDWLDTAECVLPLPNMVRRTTTNSNPIAYVPGAATPTTRKWRVIWWADTGPGQPSLPARLYKSGPTGGAAGSWDNGTVLSPIGAHVPVHQLVYDPNNPSTAYITTKQGIYRTQDDFNSPIVKVWGTDFPGMVTDLWIDPDNSNRMLAISMSSNGTNGVLKWTQNGGATWQTVLSSSGAPQTLNAISFDVGPKDASNVRRIVAMTNSSGQLRVPIVQRWNVSSSVGTLWQNSWSDAAPPPNNRWYRAEIESFPGSVNSHIKTVTSSKHQIRPYASPSNPNLWALISNSNIWHSRDGGDTWYCSTGFSGAASRQFVFDPSDPDYAFYSFYDVTGYETSEFPVKWVQYAATEAEPWYSASGGGKTASACWMIPRDAPNAAKRGRVILSSHFTNNDEAGRLLVKDVGGNWVDKLAANDLSHNGYIIGPRAEPWIVYAGRRFSDNYGDTFPIRRAYDIVACSDEAGGLSYWSTGDFTGIRRSTNYGASSSPWYTTSSRIGHTKKHPCSWLSHHEDDTMIVTDDDGNLEVVRGGSTGSRICQVNLLGMYSGVFRTNPETGESRLFTNAGAFDRFDHNVFYAWIRKFGAPAMWRVEFNDSLTAVVDISDITDNLPTHGFVSSMTTHPVTGDICTSSAQGCWIRQRPGTNNPNSNWHKCPKPHLTHEQRLRYAA